METTTTTTAAATTTTRRRLTKRQIEKLVAEIMPAITEANGRRRLRTLDEADVRWAIDVRQDSKRPVIRVWGGFVPNNYNAGGRSDCPVLLINADWTWTVYIGSNRRSRGLGCRLTEHNS